MPWAQEGAPANADVVAERDETTERVLDFYRRAIVHADATIDALALEAPGSVPWWPPEHRQVTLHQILGHVVDETARHAGHADIVRELIDGSVGLAPDDDNLPTTDSQWWREHLARVDAIAQNFRAT